MALGGRSALALSYLGLRPLQLTELSDRNSSRIARPERDGADGKYTGRSQKGEATERITESASAESAFSFLTLQSLVVKELSESAARREDGRSDRPKTTTTEGTGIDQDLKIHQALWSEAPGGSDRELSPRSTTEGQTVERDASIRTIDERFPRERTNGIDDTERLQSGVTDWAPPWLGQWEPASAESLRTSEHLMTPVEKEQAGDRSAIPTTEPTDMGSETSSPRTRRPGEKGSALQEGRKQDSILTAIGTMGERRSRLNSSIQEPRMEVLGARNVGEGGPRKGRHGVRSGIERGSDARREAMFSGEAPEMTFRRDRSAATVRGDEANRVAEQIGNSSGVEPPQSSGQEQGTREQRDTPPSAAPSLEQVVDIDRFVDRLYRGLERKQRIERERRGL